MLWPQFTPSFCMYSDTFYSTQSFVQCPNHFAQPATPAIHLDPKTWDSLLHRKPPQDLSTPAGTPLAAYTTSRYRPHALTRDVIVMSTFLFEVSFADFFSFPACIVCPHQPAPEPLHGATRWLTCLRCYPNVTMSLTCSRNYSTNQTTKA
jgi:hypothetical protein